MVLWGSKIPLSCGFASVPIKNHLIKNIKQLIFISLDFKYEKRLSTP
jgi:hypothetical protein